MRARLLPRKFKSRMMLLVAASAISVVVMFLLGALVIQALLVVWNVAIVLGIIIWEKEKSRNYKMGVINFSKDEKWSKIEKDIDWTENKLQETFSDEKRHALQSKLRSLRAQKRELEWKIQEQNMDSLYNAQSRSLKETDKFAEYQNIHKKDTVEAREDVRKQSEKLDRKYLDVILKSASGILKEEPDASLNNALLALCNDIKAHYNTIKKRDGYASTLSDYWTALVILQSVVSGSAPNSKFVRYATKDYASHFSRVMKSATSRAKKFEVKRAPTEMDERNIAAVTFGDDLDAYR